MRFHSDIYHHNELSKDPFQTSADVLKYGPRMNQELAGNFKQLHGDGDEFRDLEAVKRSRTCANAPGCVIVPQRTISNLTLFIPRYTFPPTSRTGLCYALQPERPIKLFRSAMPSKSMEESEVRAYISEQPPSISSSQPSDVFANLALHHSCIFSDTEYQPYSKHRHYQQPDRNRVDVLPRLWGTQARRL